MVGHPQPCPRSQSHFEVRGGTKTSYDPDTMSELREIGKGDTRTPNSKILFSVFPSIQTGVGGYREETSSLMSR